ncbi:MAG: tRNA (N6-isopentenyl adenosine(37)-C2)-methylthiotransferase MiaB [Candidatus Marinimicrobia bacterium]|nr:tRNA (N6-isopentenyl adenosine(37)-C2)-methylthiotransferase MiaB [Candidatus Neomarinimicrobiota bacterium]
MKRRKYYIETYGCQMNEADSELVAGLLRGKSYQPTNSPEDADIILVNTCSVRENAERRAIARLSQFKNLKKVNPGLLIGILGCVAQRDKDEVLHKNPFIDIALGPDSYRKLPEAIESVSLPVTGFQLSREEVYNELSPFRSSRVNAWISIMRGCDKFCTYCIVPFTRGRERSRSLSGIVEEVKQAVADGYSEITLLGQNVNSYIYETFRFPELLEAVSAITGLKRIRYTSPHPQDFDDRLLEVMRDHSNICHHIHLPLQSGSTRVLELMKRNYNQAKYLSVVENIRRHMPDCAITTDIIVGFPQETETDFLETLKVMDAVIFDAAYNFKYSPRPGTPAARMIDDVTSGEKSDRLNRVIEKQKRHTLLKNRALVGTMQELLVDNVSRKNPNEKTGRTGTNKIVIIQKGNPEISDVVRVRIEKAIGVSLFGTIV